MKAQTIQIQSAVADTRPFSNTGVYLLDGFSLGSPYHGQFQRIVAALEEDGFTVTSKGSKLRDSVPWELRDKMAVTLSFEYRGVPVDLTVITTNEGSASRSRRKVLTYRFEAEDKGVLCYVESAMAELGYCVASPTWGHSARRKKFLVGFFCYNVQP